MRRYLNIELMMLNYIKLSFSYSYISRLLYHYDMPFSLIIFCKNAMFENFILFSCWLVFVELATYKELFSSLNGCRKIFNSAYDYDVTIYKVYNNYLGSGANMISKKKLRFNY